MVGWTILPGSTPYINSIHTAVQHVNNNSDSKTTQQLVHYSVAQPQSDKKSAVVVTFILFQITLLYVPFGPLGICFIYFSVVPSLLCIDPEAPTLACHVISMNIDDVIGLSYKSLYMATYAGRFMEHGSAANVPLTPNGIVSTRNDDFIEVD